MKHFVYLKFKKGTPGTEILRLITDTLADILAEMAGLRSYYLMEVTPPPDDGEALLIELTFVDSDAKEQYLAHPMHLSMLRQVCGYLVDKAAFDR